MYVPPSFVERDPDTLARFMDMHGFATLVTSIEGKPVATHLPLLLDRSHGQHGALLGHLARANSQWQGGAGPALAIFAGPHAYISPTHYQAEQVVPTWNYAAVHVSGRVSYFDVPDRLREVVRRLVEKYESPRAPAWQWNAASEYSGKLLREIVGVQLEIESVEGAWKLNQNHPAERRRRVIAGLLRDGGEQGAAVAALMRETL